jgi:hypothetical protein
MFYLLSAIGGSLLTIAFFLGGVKANNNYDKLVDQITSVLPTQPEIKTTFSEPIDMKELFTNAKSPDDLIINK